ncbi:MAG TPA: hypothetical protein VEV41_25705 [Terriglobales bacterium]|nr:hypothetical protein [Terriglobales bacterium]
MVSRSASASTSETLPLFLFNVQSTRDGNDYTGVMVGTDPFNGGAGQTNVATQIVPLIIVTNTVGIRVNKSRDKKKDVISTRAGVTTFDPTVANTSCLAAPNDVPLTLFQQSPIIQPADFNFGGTDVGITQATDAFQRANFWNVIDQDDYHVRLSPVQTLAPIMLNIPAASGLALATTSLGPPAFCAPMGIVDIFLFDSIVTNQLLPALAAQGVGSGTFPIFFLSNVVLSIGSPTNLNNCCVLGYHGTNSTVPIQTYSPLDFDSTGLFGPGILNTAIASHEVGEWMDDPFGNNPVPPWGHIGQQPGCQGNLEVGDPLTGTEAPRIVMPNGFTYHLQELAFFSWFYGAPSIAVNGSFSDNNTFKTDAGPPCH